MAAQKHLIYSQNMEKLTEVILRWMEQAPEFERPFFCLRTTLLILQLSTAELAEQFVSSMPFNLDAVDVSWMINLDSFTGATIVPAN